MRFSTKGDYGLALMVGLARRHGRGSTAVRTLSQTEHVPYAYAEQLIGRLKRRRLLKSVRGSQGGYQLVREPNKITVGDIIQALEDDNLVACQRPGVTCPRQGFCRTHGVWSQIQTELQGAMDRISLTDLINSKK